VLHVRYLLLWIVFALHVPYLLSYVVFVDYTNLFRVRK
jgi:hypothetical protein